MLQGHCKVSVPALVYLVPALCSPMSSPLVGLELGTHTPRQSKARSFHHSFHL